MNSRGVVSQALSSRTRNAFDRHQPNSDLIAKSQIARGWNLRMQAPDPIQTTFPIAPAARPAAIETTDACSHVGTGREPQKRLFGGEDEVCSRCGRVV